VILQFSGEGVAGLIKASFVYPIRDVRALYVHAEMSASYLGPTFSQIAGKRRGR